MKILILPLIILLAGCGTTASNKTPGKTSFFMVSKGNASSLYQMIAGGVDYCKVTQHNLQGVQFTGEIKYDGETCAVEVTAGE